MAIYGHRIIPVRFIRPTSESTAILQFHESVGRQLILGHHTRNDDIISDAIAHDLFIVEGVDPHANLTTIAEKFTKKVGRYYRSRRRSEVKMYLEKLTVENKKNGKPV